MSKARQAIDTFLHLIADNIPAGTKVHALREDPNDPSACTLQMNAINLQPLNLSFTNGAKTASFQIVIDVINDDSNACLDVVQAVADILSAAFFTRVYDYTDPSAPVATSGNIFWDVNNIGFKRVAADKAYSHYTCTLMVRFRSI